jgi:hypothetical protein
MGAKVTSEEPQRNRGKGNDEHAVPLAKIERRGVAYPERGQWAADDEQLKRDRERDAEEQVSHRAEVKSEAGSNPDADERRRREEPHHLVACAWDWG